MIPTAFQIIFGPKIHGSPMRTEEEINSEKNPKIVIAYATHLVYKYTCIGNGGLI